MKKRIRILWSIVGVLVLLVGIAGFVLAHVFQTRSPNAVTEADGVYMEWVEEPTRDNLTFRICNESDSVVYGGSEYVVEYYFLGGWYLLYHDGATFDLAMTVVEGRTDHTVMQENPSLIYDTLPPGKYRIVKRFHTVEDFVLYENRDQYIDLYLEFELD